MSSEKNQDKRILVYLGPSVFGVIQNGTAFRGGLPPKVQALAEARPILKELFVPAGELAKAQLELRRSGSRLWMCYQEAVKALKR